MSDVDENAVLEYVKPMYRAFYKTHKKTTRYLYIHEK